MKIIVSALLAGSENVLIFSVKIFLKIKLTVLNKKCYIGSCTYIVGTCY